MLGPASALLAQAGHDCGVNESSLDRFCRMIDDHDPSGIVVPVGRPLIAAAVALLLIVVAGRLGRRFVDRTLMQAGADQQVRTLVHNVALTVIIVVAILGALTAAGLDLKVLLTVGGVASLAVGLAFQDLLRNLLAGIFLLVERPFKIGDVIAVGEIKGRVQTIELRTTVLRTSDGLLVVLPNLLPFSAPVTNYTAYDRRRFTAGVRLPRGADLPAAVAAGYQEMARTDGPLPDPPPVVRPKLEQDGGITVECLFWIDHRAHDPDAVVADLVERLQRSVRRATSPDRTVTE